MWTIMIRCQITGQPVSTGILTNKTDFSRLAHLPGSMLCPSCGDRHQWAMSYAWLGPANVEARSEGAKIEPVIEPSTPTEGG
jgi:hypothetical protein